MEIHKQSRGRYRLINNAIKTLERLAGVAIKTSLILADVANKTLCEDAMTTLKLESK